MLFYRKNLLLIAFIFIAISLNAQELFTKSLTGNSSDAEKLSIGGYTRGTIYSGKGTNDNYELKSGYAETSLKLSSKFSQWGQAFADIRYSSGIFLGENRSFLDLREAYAEIYIG